jgi:hypothetical protein
MNFKFEWQGPKDARHQIITLKPLTFIESLVLLFWLQRTKYFFSD